MRTNLTGGFLMARECYTQWMREHGGAIVNIVADMWNGMPGMGHSGAARAGMVNFTATAAAEWGVSGVRVNAVAPGWIASSGFDAYPDSVKPMLRSLRRHTPLQRFGHRGRGLRGDRLPAVARRRLHLRRDAARRRRRPQRQAPCRPCAARPLQALERLPPRRAAEDAAGGVMPLPRTPRLSSRRLSRDPASHERRSTRPDGSRA